MKRKIRLFQVNIFFKTVVFKAYLRTFSLSLKALDSQLTFLLLGSKETTFLHLKELPARPVGLSFSGWDALSLS